MIIIIQHEQSSSQHYQFDQKTSMIEINVSDRHANDYTAMKRLGGDVNRLECVYCRRRLSSCRFEDSRMTFCSTFT